MRSNLVNAVAKHRAIVTRAAIVIVLSASVLISANIVLTGPLSHNEQMYLSAGRLLQGASLYADFAYLQAPYMAYVCHWTSELTAGSYTLLVARLFKVFVVWLLIVVVYGMSAKLSGNRMFAIACSLLLANNDVFRHGIPYVTNLDMATLLTLLAFFVHLVFESHRRYLLANILAGIFVGLAIGTKLTFALVPLCFLIPIIGQYGVSKRAVYLVCCFLGGLAVAFAPAVYLSLAAGLDVAYFNNVGYHRANALWREATGFGDAMSFPGKLDFAKKQLHAFPTAVLWLACLFVTFFRAREKRGFDFKRKAVVLSVALLVAVSIAMFMIPTPTWKVYFSTFVVSLILLLSVAYSELKPLAQRTLHTVVWVSVLILLIRNGPDDCQHSFGAFDPDRWVGVRVHKSAVALRAVIPEDQRAHPVATLTPLFALEANLPIYRELATGPFAYRVGDFLSSEERLRYRTTSARSIAALLDRSPPSAIVVGFEGELDRALIDYAEERGYDKREGVIEGAAVYVRPDDRGDTDAK